MVLPSTTERRSRADKRASARNDQALSETVEDPQTARRDAAAVNFLADLEEFVNDHRPHGPLTGDATKPAWNGYLLTVARPCGWYSSAGSHRSELGSTAGGPAELTAAVVDQRPAKV